MKDMTDEINEAIKKNLPAQVGDSLQQELAELKKLRAKSATDDAKIIDLINNVAGWKLEADKMRDELNAHGKLAEREKAVEKRELTQSLNDLRVTLSNERRAEVVDLVRTIFRSPITTKSISGTVPVPVEGMHPGSGYSGNPGTVIPSMVSVTETHSQS